MRTIVINQYGKYIDTITQKVEHMIEHGYGSIEVDGKLVSYIEYTIIDGDRIVSVEVSEK